MKIIGKSNFDNETVNDILVCENVSKYYGTALLEGVNDKHCSGDSTYIFKLVPDDHVLYTFEP